MALGQVGGVSTQQTPQVNNAKTQGVFSKALEKIKRVALNVLSTITGIFTTKVDSKATVSKAPKGAKTRDIAIATRAQIYMDGRSNPLFQRVVLFPSKK